MRSLKILNQVEKIGIAKEGVRGSEASPVLRT